MDFLLQTNGPAIAVELLVKSTLLLGAALAAVYFLKGRAPSLRHSILSIAIISLLVLPVLTFVVPGWQLKILPAPVEAEPTLEEVHEELVTERLIEYRIVPIAEHTAQANTGEAPLVWNASATIHSAEPPLPPATGLNVKDVAIPAIWLLGFLFLSIRILAGLMGVSRLTRFGISLSENPWRRLYRLFMQKSPIKRNVKLVKNRRVPVPMTWGVLKPVVLMPQDSSKWSFQQCSSVLFHELAHVKRGDFLVRILARVACTVFWFNPLSWLAYRQMIREQEKACDQMVLQAGIKPSTYASSLLQVKLASTGSQRLAAAAVGMAGDSALDERLTTILDKRNTHMEVTMRTKLILIVLFIFAITLVGTANPAQATTIDQEKKVEKEKKEKKEKKKLIWVEKKKGEKGEPKIVEIDEDEEMIIKGEDGKHKKMVFISKGDKDCGHKEKHIKIKKFKGKDGESKVWVVAAPPAPPNIDGLKEQMKNLEKALADLEKGKHLNLKAIKKQQEAIKKMTDKKVKKKMEKMLQELEADLETKLQANEKTLQQMELALQKMEKQLQQKMKKIDVHVVGEHGDFDIEKHHDIIVDVHEEGDHDLLFISEGPGKDHKLNIKIDLDQTLNKEQMAKLKKALKELEKDLPKHFALDSKITKELQKIDITATKEINEKIHEALEEAMEKFEQKMEKILPEKDHKVEKRIKKKVIIKKKKSEKK
jgi:beta-lactamase regulating signal transducer with metallopeptidase domain